MPMMVLIASESPRCCQRWRKALDGEFVLHHVSERRKLVSTLREFKPGVLILDHDSTRFAKTSLIKEIIQISPCTRIVALTTHPSARDAAATIMAGAKGYYSKKLSASLLKKAAHLVAKGELWLSRKHVSALLGELISLNHSVQNGGNSDSPLNRSNSSNGVMGLSAREKEIVSLLGRGMPNKLIANELNISEKTVKAHLTVIFRKLNVTSRTELVVNITKTVIPTTIIPPSFATRIV